MKSSLYFFIFFFKVNFIFAQYGPNGDCAKSGCNGENEILRCWGSIKYFESNTIQVRVKGPIAKCFNAINDEPRNSYVWHIEVSGTPQSDFKLLIVDALGTERNIAYFKGTTLKKLVTDIHTFSNAEIINISVTDINMGSNNSSNQANNTTSSTSQQNDLTEYNRSKADLERQMAERNQEIANKRQQYLNAFNAGVNAHNSGNYSEAKSQFSTAINLSNNAQERATAQDNYNKTVKAEKSQQDIKTVTSIAQETLTGIDAIIKANKEKKQQQEANVKTENMINLIPNEKLYNSFVNDVKNEFEKMNFKFNKIDSGTHNHSNVSSDILHFENFDVLISWIYTESYGMNINLFITTFNEDAFKSIKSKKPYKKYVSSKDNLMIYSNKTPQEKSPNCFRIRDILMSNLSISQTNSKIDEQTNVNNESQTQKNVLAKKNVEDDKYYLKAEAFLEDENIKKAIEFYKKSAALGNDKAMYELGSIYNGDEDTKNEKYEDQNESKSWYEKSANLGNTSAMEQMGACYEKGVVVEKNYATASEWYLKAIENGKAPSFINLGQLYENGGYGLEKNYAIAIQYYKKVSETTSPLAYYRIGLLYLKGGFGITKDLIKAKESFKASCDKELYYFKRDHMKSREEYNKL